MNAFACYIWSATSCFFLTTVSTPKARSFQSQLTNVQGTLFVKGHVNAFMHACCRENAHNLTSTTPAPSRSPNGVLEAICGSLAFLSGRQLASRSFPFIPFSHPCHLDSCWPPDRAAAQCPSHQATARANAACASWRAQCPLHWSSS